MRKRSSDEGVHLTRYGKAGLLANAVLAGGPTWSVALGVKVLFQRGEILERIGELGSETPSS